MTAAHTRDAAAIAAVVTRYARFARAEAPGRSATYTRWAAGVADDAEVAAVIARLRPERRQPPFVFAVTRWMGAPEAGYASWRAWTLSHADAVVAACTRRRLQTNEPLRCAALLPALSLISGPIALLEVGSSAGLCLYPDRYSYRFTLDDETVRMLDPHDGPSTVVLSSHLRGGGRPALRMPDVVWRAGVDVDPLDAGDPDDRAWLKALVWPGETGRHDRVTAALDVVAADPPVTHRGDAAGILATVAARAPTAATLVITTPGVLAHVPRETRRAIIMAAKSLGRWITLDDPAVHDAWHPMIDRETWPGDAFALALDGRLIAAAHPLGAFVEWRGADAPHHG